MWETKRNTTNKRILEKYTIHFLGTDKAYYEETTPEAERVWWYQLYLTFKDLRLAFGILILFLIGKSIFIDETFPINMAKPA